MEKTLNLVEYNTSEIRDILIRYTKSHYKKLITEVVHDKYWLYDYYSSLFYASLIIQNDINYLYLRPPTEEGTKLLEYIAKAIHDDSDRVVLDASAVAWLTIDDFRWSNIRPFLATPKDLHYGLVTQCYEPIVNCCAFLAGLWSQSHFDTCFDHDDHSQAFDFISHCIIAVGISDSNDSIISLCKRRFGSHPRLADTTIA